MRSVPSWSCYEAMQYQERNSVLSAIGYNSRQVRLPGQKVCKISQNITKSCKDYYLELPKLMPAKLFCGLNPFRRRSAPLPTKSTKRYPVPGLANARLYITNSSKQNSVWLAIRTSPTLSNTVSICFSPRNPRRMRLWRSLLVGKKVSFILCQKFKGKNSQPSLSALT
jgi:hypothetical protein